MRYGLALAALGACSPSAGDGDGAEETADPADPVDPADPAGSGVACGAPYALPEPTDDEWVAWSVDGEPAKVALPGYPGAYFTGGILSIATFAADLSGSVNFGFWAPVAEGEARTYTCAAGEAFVHGGGDLGFANPGTGSACVLTFDGPFADGGRLEGAFSGQLTDLFGAPTHCLQGRFTLTDAP